MAITEFFGFDVDAYKLKIHAPEYTQAKLSDNIRTKRRQVVSSSSSIAAGLALSIPLVGATLLSAGYSARTLSIAIQKLRLLESEWSSRGLERLSWRKRDIILPLTLRIFTLALTLGVDVGFTEAGLKCVTHMMERGASHIFHEALAGGAVHGHEVTHGAMTGFADGITQGWHAFTQEGGQFFVGDVSHCDWTAGYGLGEWAGAHALGTALTSVTSAIPLSVPSHAPPAITSQPPHAPSIPESCSPNDIALPPNLDLLPYKGLPHYIGHIDGSIPPRFQPPNKYLLPYTSPTGAGSMVRLPPASLPSRRVHIIGCLYLTPTQVQYLTGLPLFISSSAGGPGVEWASSD
ncbi:hypothetical protein JAAARDRAFT_192772 [Jaapia argillacea MUCL 33604]|uniref:Uncharacterized protein n=1 Tax=Jaapia argillacea MUCL 33604 TaxID=933084 RepID=A0A067PZD8_9AGAM|nr:hypothetical protein JAAARDRAFT_192772 [Jaapia argillacea MUCL 33604]